MSNNYIVRLFKGDIPLVITFWIFHVLIGVAFICFAEVILELEGILYALIFILYFGFIAICVWRSANKYRGTSIWKILAKISVVLHLLGGLLDILASQASVEDQIIEFNSQLPQMIEEGDRLDFLVIKGKEIQEKHTVTDSLIKDINIEVFIAYQKQRYKDNECLHQTVLSWYKEGYTSVASYYDNKGEFITTVTNNLTNCTE